MSAPSKLPAGWSKSRIGDVVEDRIEQGLPEDKSEFTYIDISAVDNRLKEIVQPKKLPTAKAPSRARQQIKSGDVLVSTTRPNLNAVALVPPQLDGAIASTGFAVLRPVLLESRWLHSVVQSEDFVTEMSALVKGALYPAIRPSHVHDYVMPVPPLPEQKRITSRLAKLLKRARNVSEALEALPALIQQYRAAVLEAACTGRLLRGYRESHPYETKRFGDLVESSLYGPRFSAKDYSSKGVPTLRTTDMDFNGAITLRDTPRVKVSEKDLDRFGLRNGDLLITRTGATIGKCAIYDWSLGPAIPGAYLIRFRLMQDQLSPKFALIFFMSPAGQDLLTGSAKAVAQPNVNATSIAEFDIPLPPLTEQGSIVTEVERRIRALDHIEFQVKNALEDTTKLRTSLFHRALFGKLVEQNLSDEPASKLISRIRMLKDQLATQPKVRTYFAAPFKPETLPMLTLEDIKPTHLADILRNVHQPLAACEVWRASGLSIDDFYAQLKKELGKSLKETGKQRVLEVKS